MPSKRKTPAPASTPHIIISKPISLLHRELKLDVKGLFKALGKAVAHFGAGKYAETAADFSDATCAIGLKADAGGLAWLLIRQSMLRAMHTLAAESWLHRASLEPPHTDELEARFDAMIADFTLELTRDFFRQPGALAFIDPCSKWFCDWLIAVGLARSKAFAISERLRPYFVYALNQEWRDRPDVYAPIVSLVNTPFTSASDSERAWEQYSAWLNQEIDGPMFGEPFSLRQLYIPLRAWYQKGDAGMTEAPEKYETGNQRKRIAVELEKHLLMWVGATDRDDAVRVLSGGPGSGKSSVAKMLTTKVLKETSWRALYIPLHRIKYKGDLIPAINDYIRDSRLLPGHATLLSHESSDRQLLLLFDGLDELAMLGKVAKETVSQFVRAVKDVVRDQNTTGLRLKVILTGRTVIMENLEPEFRREGAVLHVCPYYVSDQEKDHFIYGWKILENEDQRQTWWKLYGEMTGQHYDGLPKHFDRDNLIEVSSEPLLNYLLALANKTTTLDFSLQVTENQIYASLVHELYERRWAGGENFALMGMREDHFHHVLEEIAVAAWHGDGRKTTVGEIKQHCQDAGITKMLEIFQEGAENGVLRLLTAFFFRQAGVRDDENAFEFTHKSFGEYLVARRIVRMLITMSKKVQEQLKDFTGWDERKCLEEWGRLCGPSPMTERQWKFLQNEMYCESADPSAWQPLIITLINSLLRHGMPMEKLGIQCFRSMQSQSRNAEEALILSLSSCSRVTTALSVIDWPEANSSGEWIKRLQGQRTDGSSVAVMSSLDRIDFIDQQLHIADLFGARLNGSSFDNANMQLACLRGAMLMRTSFKRTIMLGVDLEDANVTSANLHGAVMSSGRFRRAVLEAAICEDAHIENGDFRKANLTGALLRGASLSNADFTQSNLTNANLEGAILDNAILVAANLQGANLKNADLTGADLREANLKDADLTGALIEHTVR